MHSVYVMRPVAPDGVTWSVVCHVREPCKNGWTDRDDVGVLTQVSSRNHILYIRWGRGTTTGWDNFGGSPAHWKAMGVSVVVFYTAKNQ